ncbi:MAG: hypothetical protein U0232_06515 [Thermomicrobiales bacterium]
MKQQRRVPFNFDHAFARIVLYVTIGFVVLVIALTTFGSIYGIPDDYIAPSLFAVLMVILGGLAHFSTILEQLRVANLPLSASLSVQDIENELEKYPEEAVFWGTTHSELIPGTQAKLREHIQSGMKLQVILISKDEPVVEMAALRATPSNAGLSMNHIKGSHHNTENALLDFRARKGKDGGEVHYYRLPYLPSFTLVGFDLHSHRGVIYVRFAELESYSELRPTVRFTARQDPVWFAHYRDQWEKASRSAKEVEFNNDSENPGWL